MSAREDLDCSLLPEQPSATGSQLGHRTNDPMLLGFPRLQSSGGKKGDENRKWIVSGSGNERREEEQENKRGRKRQLKLTSEHVTVAEACRAAIAFDILEYVRM